MAPKILSDQSLARRLERAEATANACFVEARARLAPASGAQWIEVAGAYAMYDGARSPCTQTFGLGLFQMPTVADMDKLETFFKDLRAPVFHEISPLADKALLPMLSERGYRPVELTSVMFLPLGERAPAAVVPKEPLQVRVVSQNNNEQERDLWARTSAEGWRESTEIADLILGLGHIASAAKGNVSFLVELHGQPIAAGGLAVHGNVALFAGASTIHEWRRTRQRLPAQRRTPRIPHRLHPHQVGLDGRARAEPALSAEGRLACPSRAQRISAPKLNRCLCAIDLLSLPPQQASQENGIETQPAEDGREQHDGSLG